MAQSANRPRRPRRPRRIKTWLVGLTLFCGVATVASLYVMGRFRPEDIQAWVGKAGPWAPLLYVGVYVIATLLILPSTALNLTGGGLFGPWWGTLWTTVGAIVAAAIAFFVSRTLGRTWFEERLAGRWQAMDTEVRRGGLFYMFAIRLVPIMPYGLVNFAAGLTSIRFRDYLIGTTVGTVPSVLPFVLIGSSSLQAFSSGNLWPLMGALALTGVLVIVSTIINNRLKRRTP